MSGIVEMELIGVDNWLKKNKIKVNYDKSRFIAFSYRKEVVLSHIKLRNSVIPKTDSFKFLGVVIDKNLSFNDHISTLCSKVSKSIGILYCLNKFLPSDILIKLYHTLIASRLSYGIEAWFGASQALIDRVRKLQKRAVRAIYALPYNSHTNNFFKSSKILKVDDLHNLRLGMHMFDGLKTGRFTLNSNFHNYGTRNHNSLVTPLCHKSKSQLSWVHRGIKLWENLPVHVKHSKSSNQFKCTLRDHVLESY